jgi:hypothetical protein
MFARLKKTSSNNRKEKTMTITRPSLVANLKAKFNDPKSGYSYDKCLEITHKAIKQKWFTNILNEYPSLLCKKDMLNLIYRFLDLLRNLPEASITEDFVIQKQDSLKVSFNQFIKDIACIGAKELLDLDPKGDSTFDVNRAPLTKEVSNYLQLNTKEFQADFENHASEVVVSYLGTVLADIYNATKRYSEQYPKAFHAWNEYLKVMKLDLVQTAMSQASNTIDLHVPGAQTNRNIYWVSENTSEFSAAAGLTLVGGVFGLGAYAVYKIVTPNEFEKELDARPTPG